ncbi:hypothetical protein [Falsigemmobacter intermedius]|uniref:hypothetical protein n=1 Tax=Falsigemmobacter intermedius TaxID=1553448 RepID=UPI003F0A120E
MTDSTPRQLVLMKWLDSRQPVTSWCYLSDFPQGDVSVCQSVGWLLQDGEVKVLCQTVGDLGSDTEQGMGFLQIPACSVISVTELTSWAQADQDVE